MMRMGTIMIMIMMMMTRMMFIAMTTLKNF